MPAMRCPICESSSALALIKDGRPYFQCSSCEFLFHRAAQEDPGKSALSFYDQSYWKMERKEALRRENEDSFIRALELLYLSGIKVEHVLELGCGLGITVQMLREKLGLNAVGVDLSADFEETKYLHRCEVGALRSLYPPEYFDAIYSIEVFEHLEDPKQVISMLGTLLKPGGRILINTGTREYLSKYDPEMTYIDPLRRGHISIYSLRSLSHLASMIGRRAEFMGARTYAVIMSPPGELSPVPHPDNIETIRRLGDWFPMLLREYMRLIFIEQESENKGIWAYQLLKEGETLRSERRKLEEDLDTLRNEQRLLKEHGVDDDDLASLAESQELIDEVERGVEEANEGLSRVEQVKRFKVLSAPWDPGGDELTPTMKRSAGRSPTSTRRRSRRSTGSETPGARRFGAARRLPRPLREGIRDVRRTYRSARYRGRERLRPTRLTGADVEHALREAGLQEGDGVFMQAAMSAFGSFERGPDSVLEGLERVVGPEGLVAMPTFPISEPAIEYLSRDPVFDVRETPSQMGAVSERFRHGAATRRSVHLTHPIAVRGPVADEIVAGHEFAATPFGEGTPFPRLIARDALQVFFGCGTGAITMYHSFSARGASVPARCVR